MINSVDHYDALDEILEYLVERKGETISYRQIKNDVFPKIEIDTFVALANQILNTDTAPPYIAGRIFNGYGDWLNDGEISATSVTEAFLKQGGFKKYFADQQKKSTDETLAKTLDIQLKQKSLTKLKYDKAAFWIASITAILGLLFAIITRVTQSKLEQSIQQLEQRMYKPTQEVPKQKTSLQKSDTTTKAK